MNISAITVRDLEYLVAVGKYLHFGKAASALHVSQPTLSAQVRKLEELMNVRIFERSNRSIVVTTTGEKILRQALVVLEEAQKLIDLARETSSASLSGPLRLGTIATLGPYYMPHVLAPLRKHFPALELHLREGITEKLILDLKAGNLDAVIASRTFTDDSLMMIPLFFEPFLVVMPRSHSLSEKDYVKPADLCVGEMILLEDGHCLTEQTLEVCPANRRGNFREYHATSLETLRHLVASGIGYSLMPSLAATYHDVKLQDLISYRAFEDGQTGREIVLVCRKHFPRMDDLFLLADFLRVIRPEGTFPVK